MEGTTRRLADFVAVSRYEDLPPLVVREAKRLLLDTIGCAIGATETESGRIALEYARLVGGHDDATVAGTGERTSAPTAAYANGRLANVLDADDTFPSGSHFGCSTVFSALALGEQQHRSGRDLLTAIAVGFDVGARLGSALGLPILVQDGKVVGYRQLYGVATTMTWAAAGAAASIAGLDPATAGEAFGIAGANTPIPAHAKWSASVRLPMHKYADGGWCAQIGVTASLLAGLGSTGYSDILDGDPSLFRFVGCETCDFEALTGGLGERWQLLQTTYKPWPSCRWTHYPLTAFSRLRDEHHLRPEEIDHVVVRANPMAQSARFKNAQPVREIDAEFSHAHAIAMGAFEIPAGPLWYAPETLSAPHIVAFRERVSVELEPSAANLAQWMEGGQFRRIPGGVDVHARGQVFSSTVELAWGDPWSPETEFTDEALRAKLARMVAGRDPSSTDRVRHADEIVEAVDRLEEIDDLNEFGRLLATQTAPIAG